MQWYNLMIYKRNILIYVSCIFSDWHQQPFEIHKKMKEKIFTLCVVLLQDLHSLSWCLFIYSFLVLPWHFNWRDITLMSLWETLPFAQTNANVDYRSYRCHHVGGRAHLGDIRQWHRKYTDNMFLAPSCVFSSLVFYIWMDGWMSDFYFSFWNWPIRNQKPGTK